MTQIGLYAQLGNIGRFSVVFLFLKTFPKIFFDTTSLKRNEPPTTDLWSFYFRQTFVVQFKCLFKEKERFCGLFIKPPVLKLVPEMHSYANLM